MSYLSSYIPDDVIFIPQFIQSFEQICTNITRISLHAFFFDNLKNKVTSINNIPQKIQSTHIQYSYSNSTGQRISSIGIEM